MRGRWDVYEGMRMEEGHLEWTSVKGAALRGSLALRDRHMRMRTAEEGRGEGCHRRRGVVCEGRGGLQIPQHTHIHLLR
jgi:hypothetical protein